MSAANLRLRRELLIPEGIDTTAAEYQPEAQARQGKVCIDWMSGVPLIPRFAGLQTSVATTSTWNDKKTAIVRGFSCFSGLFSINGFPIRRRPLASPADLACVADFVIYG